MARVPWSKALTSFPFMAIVLCNFTYEWGVYTFEKLFPLYTKEMLSMEIQWNDWFYIMPYFGLWLLVMASGGGADRLQSHGVLSTTATRKIMQLIGAIIPASMIAAMGFIDCSKWHATISFNTIGLAFCGFQYNGFLVNHLDIAPRFAGMLMGIANAIGSTAGFLVPPLLGIVTTSAESKSEQWQTVFLISASFYIVSTAFFILCGSGKLQEWAVEPASLSPHDNPDNFSDIFPHIDPDDGNADPSITRTSLITRGVDFGDKQQPQPELIFTSDTLRKNKDDDDYDARNLRSLRTQKSIGAVSVTGTLPRPAAVVPNHLTAASEQVPYDDEDGLNRKSSNKSTNSSRSNDSVARRGPRARTDHEREERGHRSRYGVRERDREREKEKDRERERDKDRDRDRDREREKDRDRRSGGGTNAKRSDSSAKRPPKPAKLTQEESFDIYESLSESPV